MEYIALQLFNGLVNGSFYALLSLGLAVIIGVLRVVNFAHGALYMLGAFAAYLLLQDFGVGFWVAPGIGFGVALAALGGGLAAPTRNVSPLMGSELIIFAFAVVVIGGMGSIAGAVVAGFLVGVLASLAAVFNPALENVVAFALMAVVLLVRPAGLFGSLEARS